MGVVFMGAGLLLLDQLTILVGMNHHIRPVSEYILRIYLYTLPAYYLLIAGNAVFRARRETAFPLLVMMTVALLNLLGNLTLGLGLWNFPSFGYKGLAWSTFISVICGTFLVLFLLNRHGLLRKTDILQGNAVPSALGGRKKVEAVFKHKSADLTARPTRISCSRQPA